MIKSIFYVVKHKQPFAETVAETIARVASELHVKRGKMMRIFAMRYISIHDKREVNKDFVLN